MGIVISLVSGIVLIVCGALCMPSIIAKKRPEAKELLEKIAKFQGWIGLVICIWGICGIFMSILDISWITTWPLWWLTGLVANVLNFGVGFLLGFGMIQQLILSKAPDETKVKAEALHKKLVGMQIPLGYTAIIVGLWVILYGLIIRHIVYM